MGSQKTYIDLYATALTSEILSEQFHKGLKRVTLRNVSTRDRSPTTLFEALSRLTLLEVLHFEESLFMRNHYSVLFSRVLYRNSVQELILRSQELIRVDLKQLRKGLSFDSSLKRLTIHGCSQSDTGFCELLKCDLDYLKMDVGIAPTPAYSLLARSFSSNRARIKEVNMSVAYRYHDFEYKNAAKWVLAAFATNRSLRKYRIIGWDMAQLGYPEDLGPYLQKVKGLLGQE